MITVTRKLFSEEELNAEKEELAHRYNIPNDCCDESAADLMSDFDAQKWLSLCDMIRTARRRRHEVLASCDIPYSLRSIYGRKAPFQSQELENTPDSLALAA